MSSKQKRNPAISYAVGVALGLIPAVGAGENATLSGNENTGAAVQYAGEDLRIGAGVDGDGHAMGDIFAVLAGDEQHTWSGNAWVADNAGGLKLNYHWLKNNAEGDPEAVNKVFFAADRNRHGDGKVTAGWGRESASWFYGTYLAHGVSGSRRVGRDVQTSTDIISGTDGAGAYTQEQITSIITNTYETPFDWGVGLRIGRFSDEHLVRVRGGLDHEWGDDGGADASQTTLSVGVEKFLRNSPHSFAVDAALYRRDGNFEKEKQDLRIGAQYRYSFGQPYVPASSTREVKREVKRETVKQETRTETRLVAHKVTVDSTAVFKYDSAELTDAAKTQLDKLLVSIRTTGGDTPMLLQGHTCDLGSDAYNMSLSKRRAQSVRDYLAAKGVPEKIIVMEAKGESTPRVPNTSEANRQQNRRVEIRFVTTEQIPQVITTQAPAEPRIEWETEIIEEPPAWMKRALRNVVAHKREVDYYRVEKTTTQVTLGEREYLNNAPVANDDSAETTAGTPVLIDVLANDSDPDGDNIAIPLTPNAPNGSVEIVDDKLLYTPNPGFEGVDTFSYLIGDTLGLSDSATVTVTVHPAANPNGAPVANDDTVQTIIGTPVVIDVLANDSDPDGDSLTISTVGGASHGSVEIVNGNLRYVPEAGFQGMDVFSYTVEDGNGGSDTASVTVIMVPNPEVNNDPIAVTDNASTVSGGSVSFNVLNNDTDPDGDTLLLSDITQPSQGSLTFDADGTVSYTAPADFVGTTSASYTVLDGRGGSAFGTIVIDVTAVGAPGNQPPVAVNDGFRTNVNSPRTVDLLANDSDPDGDTLVIVNVEQPANGTVVINGDGTVTYTPNTDFCGTDIFVYTVSDEHGGMASATVTATVGVD